MFKNPLSSLKEKITQYIQLRFELIRLEIIERTVNVMGYFAFIIIAIFLFFAFGMFAFLAVAECLKVLFNGNAPLAYLATAFIILLVTLIVIGFSKKIIRFFAGKMAILLTKNYHKEDEDSEEKTEG